MLEASGKLNNHLVPDYSSPLSTTELVSTLVKVFQLQAVVHLVDVVVFLAAPLVLASSRTYVLLLTERAVRNYEL